MKDVPGSRASSETTDPEDDTLVVEPDQGNGQPTNRRTPSDTLEVLTVT